MHVDRIHLTQERVREAMCCVYSRTPLIRTLVIRIANYPDRLCPSCKHFLTVSVPYLFMAYIPPLSNTYKVLCINVLFVRK